MATYSTGIACTFAGYTFGEVQVLGWSFGSDLPKGRGSNWTDQKGSVTISALSSTGIGSSVYGTRGTLAITGGGMTFSATVVCVGCEVSAELNGVTRYAASFTIVES